MSLVVPALAWMSLRATLRSRRLVVAGLVALIPILLGLALLAGEASQHGDPNASASFQAEVLGPVTFLILGGTVPFIAMLLAGSIVADDVEDRTFSYVLVRPLRRHQVYLSRLVPAACVAAALAVAQVVAFGLLRLLSWSLHGQGSFTHTWNGRAWTYTDTFTAILTHTGTGIAAAALASVAFLALFGFVTVLTTRYHFLANVLLFAAVELVFGNLGGRGAGVVTITYHARSALYAAGELENYHAAPWPVALIVLMGMAVLWTWLAMRQMGRRDFNVTSAAS